MATLGLSSGFISAANAQSPGYVVPTKKSVVVPTKEATNPIQDAVNIANNISGIFGESGSFSLSEILNKASKNISGLSDQNPFLQNLLSSLLGIGKGSFDLSEITEKILKGDYALNQQSQKVVNTSNTFNGNETYTTNSQLVQDTVNSTASALANDALKRTDEQLPADSKSIQVAATEICPSGIGSSIGQTITQGVTTYLTGGLFGGVVKRGSQEQCLKALVKQNAAIGNIQAKNLQANLASAQANSQNAANTMKLLNRDVNESIGTSNLPLTTPLMLPPTNDNNGSNQVPNEASITVPAIE
jgi:hypothetical protein